MSMPADEAIRLLANHLVANAFQGALQAECVGWEDYPEVGQYDFEKVVARAREVTAGLRPTTEAFKVAYEVLAGRAGEGEAP